MGRLKLFGSPPGGAPGVTDHAALENLPYALSGHVGFVPSQGEALIDILRLNQNLIRDSGGNNRILLAAASPHLTLTGDVRGTQHAAFAGAAVSTERLLNVDGDNPSHPAIAAYCRVFGTSPSDLQATMGLMGAAAARGTPLFAFVYGLYFYAGHETPSLCAGLTSIYAQLQSGVAGTGAISSAYGLYFGGAGWIGSKPTTVTAICVLDQGHASVSMAYGLKIADQTAASVRLLELGPYTPYLRLLGGANPAAGETNLFLKVGPTLKHVYEDNGFLKVN